MSIPRHYLLLPPDELPLRNEPDELERDDELELDEPDERLPPYEEPDERKLLLDVLTLELRDELLLCVPEP